MRDRKRDVTSIMKLMCKIQRYERRAYIVRGSFGCVMTIMLLLFKVFSSCGLFFCVGVIVILWTVEAYSHKRESEEFAKYMRVCSKQMYQRSVKELRNQYYLLSKMFCSWETTPIYAGSLFLVGIVLLGYSPYKMLPTVRSDSRLAKRDLICARCARVKSVLWAKLDGARPCLRNHNSTGW